MSYFRITDNPLKGWGQESFETVSSDSDHHTDDYFAILEPPSLINEPSSRFVVAAFRCEQQDQNRNIKWRVSRFLRRMNDCNMKFFSSKRRPAKLLSRNVAMKMQTLDSEFSIEDYDSFSGNDEQIEAKNLFIWRLRFRHWAKSLKKKARSSEKCQMVNYVAWIQSSSTSVSSSFHVAP